MHTHQKKQWVEGDRDDRVGRHALGPFPLARGDDRDAGGEEAHRNPQGFGVGLVDLPPVLVGAARLVSRHLRLSLSYVTAPGAYYVRRSPTRSALARRSSGHHRSTVSLSEPYHRP